ncbi:MBL fold metallo-hydrolase [Pontiella sp.]|uniref:MBL fold metallo-hydrolase n=1 Tax=Pontiella sp. TaxID=2837462 RepID=UPI0035649FFD
MSADFQSLEILVDNAAAEGLAAEHGFSVLLRVGGKTFLMDSGQHNALEKNAAALGIDLTKLDGFILSHGHYDHTGAADFVLQENPEVQVYAHPKIFSERYSIYPERGPKEISMPSEQRLVVANLPDSQLHWISGPTEIAPGVWLTGPIPRFHTLEDTGGFLFQDADGVQPDPVEDDMAMWIETPDGLWVICGCCHSGLVNTLTYIGEVSRYRPIRGILGGFHLKHASDERLAATVDTLQAYGPDRMVPCHCTGESAVTYFKNHLQTEIETSYAGFVVKGN